MEESALLYFLLSSFLHSSLLILIPSPLVSFSQSSFSIDFPSHLVFLLFGLISFSSPFLSYYSRFHFLFWCLPSSHDLVPRSSDSSSLFPYFSSSHFLGFPIFSSQSCLLFIFFLTCLSFPSPFFYSSPLFSHFIVSNLLIFSSPLISSPLILSICLLFLLSF